MKSGIELKMQMTLTRIFLLIFGFFAAGGMSVWAVPSLKLTPVFEKIRFDQPIFLTGVPGTKDRIAVVEQSGKIKIFDNSPHVSRATVFLDLSEKIVTGYEEGLLGLAFDPHFVKNGYFYVYYSTRSPRRSVISRFSVKKHFNSADPSTEKVILEVKQPYSNHNAGMLAFGPDDYLYIALGDGGAGGDPRNHGQNRTTLLGSILRIDPHGGSPYRIPTDNPFVGLGIEEAGRVGAGSPIRTEIWAYGLRNPWRFSFDRVEGTLWAGDVGQNEIEEIDIIESGKNYGWRIFEGTERYDSRRVNPRLKFVEPVVEYTHEQGYSVIGGYVYRGKANEALQGFYFYGDFAGKIWALAFDGHEPISNTAVLFFPQISSFGEDQKGEIYVVSLRGKIARIDAPSP